MLSWLDQQPGVSVQRARSEVVREGGTKPKASVGLFVTCNKTSFPLVKHFVNNRLCGLKNLLPDLKKKFEREADPAYGKPTPDTTNETEPIEQMLDQDTESENEKS